MCHVTRLVLLIVAFAVIAPTTANARTWTDRTGRQLEAEFVGFVDGKVELKRSSDRKTFFVPIARLSDADQAFARSQAPGAPSLPKVDARGPAANERRELIAKLVTRGDEAFTDDKESALAYNAYFYASKYAPKDERIKEKLSAARPPSISVVRLSQRFQ